MSPHRAPQIDFEPDQHRYFVAGVERPGVTRVLKDCRATPPYPDDQGWLEFGKNVHRCCELLLLGRLGIAGDTYPGTSQVFWPYLNGFIEKAREMRIQLIACEQRVYHEIEGYAGTLDLHCTLHGNPEEEAIIDLKTGAPAAATALQTAAYDLALSHMQGRPASRRRRFAMHLTPDRAKITNYEDPFDYTAWLGCFHFWKWREKA